MIDVGERLLCAPFVPELLQSEMVVSADYANECWPYTFHEY